MGAFYVFIIMVMRVLQSLYNKKAALMLPDGIRPYISYVAVSKLMSAMFALVLILPTMNFSGMNPQAFIIAGCSGICLAIGSLCGIKALLGGTIALSSLFGTAGMIIPIILSSIFFNESVSMIQLVCILVLFIAILMMVSATKDTLANFSFKTIGYLIGSFLSNGAVMFCQKLFGELQPDGNVSLFSMMTFLIPAIVMFFTLPVMSVAKTEKGQSERLPKKLLLYALILAFAVFMIQQLVTILTPVMSSAVLFTLVNGGATVIAAIVGAFVYKEKVTPKIALGIVLGLAALICIKVFE